MTIIDTTADHDGDEAYSRLDDPAAIADLRHRWSQVSRERLGLSRQQWQHPATVELLRAIAAGEELQRALARLGEARASAGISLTETLTDLAVLDEVLPAPLREQPIEIDGLEAAASVGQGWTEARFGEADPTTCVDELTGLVTTPFLEARLGQVYRHCHHLGMRPTEAFALVVAQLGRGEASPFTRVAQRLRLAGDLRICFPGSDTLAVLDPTATTHTMVALTSRVPELQIAVDALRVGAGQRRAWIEPLPDDLVSAVDLVRDLPEAR